MLNRRLIGEELSTRSVKALNLYIKFVIEDLAESRSLLNSQKIISRLKTWWLLELTDYLKMTLLDEKGRLLVIWLMKLIKFVWLEDWRPLKLKFIWRMISNTKGEIVSANIIVSEIIIWENNIQVKASQRWKSKMLKSSIKVKVKDQCQGKKPWSQYCNMLVKV